MFRLLRKIALINSSLNFLLQSLSHGLSIVDVAKRLSELNVTQQILGGLVAVVFAISLIVLVFQETFKDILIPLGLYNEKSGVYVNCDLPENRNKRLCGGQESPAANQEFKGGQGGPGFSLSGS